MGARSSAVDRYLKNSPSAQRQAFAAIRDLIHTIQPDVHEIVQYNMPLFDYHGLLCGFASQPQAITLYCRADIVERYQTALGKLVVSKGCIRFQTIDELPMDTLRALFRDSCTALQNEATKKSNMKKETIMPTQIAPPPTLHYQGRQLITAPTHYGTLRDSRDVVSDAAALRGRMQEDGYLYLPGVLDANDVKEARRSVLRQLEAEGAMHPDYPLEDGIIADGVHFTFRPDLANGNPTIEQLLYTGPIMALMHEFLGGPVLHYDFTWLRAKAPGPNTATSPHCDIVFMNRGTHNLYTVWTPLEDIPYDLGGLIVLENSHRNQEHLGEYWEFDVDTYCVDDKNDEAHNRWAWGNGGGSFSKDAIGVRQEIGGRWLGAEYKAGDLLIFSMFTLHASLDNCTNRVRLSTDSRYQLASEAVDERWIGENPIAHGPESKKGLIC